MRALTVIVPTHNPDPERLRRTLQGLQGQSLARSEWQTLVIDNASPQFPSREFFQPFFADHFSIVREPQLGLSSARRRGFIEAESNFVVLVDDDNVLAPDYLAQVVQLFTAHPRVGALGGKSVPEFEVPPSTWAKEFLPLLALRDLGPEPTISNGLRSDPTAPKRYPLFAPIGAGMALRRSAWQAWLAGQTQQSGPLTDRRGSELTSSGDNDIVLAAMNAGWEVGYFPSLSLVHLIPARRLQAEYLARLNRGVQKSWMQVLTRHQANPWPPLSRAGARLRQIKTWLTFRPWYSTAARIRWQGACGHFEGRVAL